jgi:hypothetical protein
MININQLIDYLQEKIPDFQKTSKRGQVLMSCPRQTEHKFVTKDPTMTVITGTDKFYCLCCGFKGNSYDLIRLVEKSPQMTDTEVINFITNKTKIDLYPELDNYYKYGFWLFAIAKNSKVPIANEHWRQKEYCSNEKAQWIKWLEAGHNLAVNCEFSNVMIVDADLYNDVQPEFVEIRDELKKLLEDNKTLVQNTVRGGKHYVLMFDGDLCFKQKVNLGGGLKIDTRTHKGYFLVSPSKVYGNSYNWINLGNEIKIVTPELKIKLLEIIKMDKKDYPKSDMQEEPQEKSDNPILLTANNLDGCCNDTFVKFGGALIKMGIPVSNVKPILFYLNKNWLKQPMPVSAIEGMLNSLEGYKDSEETTQQNAIYEACQLIQNDISAKDILEHVYPGDNKKRAIVNKWLAQFYKEGKLIRKRQGRYDLKNKVEWTDEKDTSLSEITFKMPYFDEVAHFHSGDILLLGAPQGAGKTHIAINMIKAFKNQGIKPYYISLESGSRHGKIAETLGLSQKDYYISKESIDNPLQIELEKSAITLLDWVYTGEDFSATLSVFKHLNDEMSKKKGNLIVFTQLKETYDYFAVNLIKSFPAFAARFIYDSEDRSISHWQIDKIRDPIGNYSNAIIPLTYNFETKILKKKE